MAKAIDREENWARLGQQALKQGNHKVRLSFPPSPFECIAHALGLTYRWSRSLTSAPRTLTAFRSSTSSLATPTSSPRWPRLQRCEETRCRGSTTLCTSATSRLGSPSCAKSVFVSRFPFSVFVSEEEVLTVCLRPCRPSRLPHGKEQRPRRARRGHPRFRRPQRGRRYSPPPHLQAFDPPASSRHHSDFRTELALGRRHRELL